LLSIGFSKDLTNFRGRLQDSYFLQVIEY